MYVFIISYNLRIVNTFIADMDYIMIKNNVYKEKKPIDKMDI
jgi:hypothetical protein